MDNFKKQVALSLVIILGSFLVLGVALYLASLSLKSESDKVLSDKTAIATRTAALQALASFKSDSSLASRYKQAMERLLVPQEKLIEFPRSLEKLARAYQVSESFSFQGAQVAPQGDAAGYIGFSLSAGGTLDNLMDFLKGIEYSEPQFLVSFETFDLSRSGAGYSALINGRVFFR